MRHRGLGALAGGGDPRVATRLDAAALSSWLVRLTRDVLTVSRARGAPGRGVTVSGVGVFVRPAARLGRDVLSAVGARFGSAVVSDALPRRGAGFPESSPSVPALDVTEPGW